jgi:hydroxymethylglutaryl-CoA lyase
MGPKEISIREVGPRDGFQNIVDFIPTEEKVKIVNMLVHSGVSRLEVSSFVHPKWIPQLADAAEVFARIDKRPGVEYSVLIPNARGLERAIECGVPEVEWVISATDGSNKENVNMTVDESLAVIAQAAEKAKAHGIRILGAVANSLGCPYEGDVPVEKVIKVVKAYTDLGIEDIIIADSIGMAGPEQVKTLLTRLLKEFPDAKFSVHLHDILGIGPVNAYAAYEAGVTNFDSSISGLGGCPYQIHPGGNIATEELVHMFDKMGVNSGIELNKLLETSRYVRSIVGENPRKQEGHSEEG